MGQGRNGCRGQYSVRNDLAAQATLTLFNRNKRRRGTLKPSPALPKGGRDLGAEATLRQHLLNHIRLNDTYLCRGPSQNHIPRVQIHQEFVMTTISKGLLILSFLTLATTICLAQAQPTASSQTTAAQSRVVGVVTAIDKGASQLTVKTDAGEMVTVLTNDKSSLLRLPPGETSAQNAAKIMLAEIAVGDRVFAKGTTASDGKSLEARQVVVSGGAVAAAVPADSQRQREDGRQRGLVGRVTTLDASKKEITVQSRSREGTGPVVIAISDSTKVFRYAPDSLNIKDASRSSLSDIKVGDQLRALGERSADGGRFTATEIIAGSMTRTVGQVVAVNAEKNELTIKNAQGQNINVVVGQRSSLRRVTPEMAATFEANRPQRAGGGNGQRQAQNGQAQNGQAQNGQAQNGQDRRPRERREGAAAATGANGEERRQRPGRGFQEMLENLPAITVADLKKGDTVFVSGSEGVDASRVTAIMLITGDAAFMGRFMQQGPNRGPQSPGLPGDVIGGGVGPAERPTNP